MTEKTSLASFEESVFRSRFDDGLLDVLVGLGISLLGGFWLIPDLAGLSGVAPALLIPFWPILRKRITEPRIGQVEFSPPRRADTKRGLRGILVTGMGAFLLGVVVFAIALRGGMDTLRPIVPMVPGIILAVGLALGGAMVKAPRFFAYSAWMLAVSVLMGALLRFHPGAHMLTGGLLILVSGTVLLTQFLRKNPVLQQGS